MMIFRAIALALALHAPAFAGCPPPAERLCSRSMAQKLNERDRERLDAQDCQPPSEGRGLPGMKKPSWLQKALDKRKPA